MTAPGPPWLKKTLKLQRQIDNLVYEIYGLTEEEIAIIEEATEKR